MKLLVLLCLVAIFALASAGSGSKESKHGSGSTDTGESQVASGSAETSGSSGSGEVSAETSGSSGSAETSKERKGRHKKEVSTCVTDTYTACATGGDVTAAKTTEVAKLTELGCNMEKFDSFFNSIVSCSTILNTKGSKERGVVNYCMGRVIRDLDIFIGSQRKFYNFCYDSKKRKDPVFTNFYIAYEKQRKAFNDCRKKAQKADGCFNNDTAILFADVVIEAHVISKTAPPVYPERPTTISAPTTPSAYPDETPEEKKERYTKEVTSCVTNTYAVCSRGGNITAAKAVQRTKLTEIGCNMDKFDDYFDSVVMCSSIMNPKSSKEKGSKEQGLIDYCMADVMKYFDIFISSQNGFYNFGKDGKKKKDKKFKRFYSAYGKQKKAFDKCKKKPKKADACFNADTASICSEIFVEIITISTAA